MDKLIQSKQAEIITGGSAVEQMTRGTVEVQAALAHRFPRDTIVARNRAEAIATSTQEMAGACFYSMPRGGRNIEGPSVRLAEILAQCWGNMSASSYLVSVGETSVVCRGECWDLESNYRVTQDRDRRITNRDGKRYGDDMISTTVNACAAIAYREAVLKCIGKAIVDPIWQQCRRVSIGDVRSIGDSWASCVDHFRKMGIDERRLLVYLGQQAIGHVTADDIGRLRGLATALKDGEISLDSAFPPGPGDDTVKTFGRRPKAAQAAKPVEKAPPVPKAQPAPQVGNQPTPAPQDGQHQGAQLPDDDDDQGGDDGDEITIMDVKRRIQEERIDHTKVKDLLKLSKRELAVAARALGLDVRGNKGPIAERIALHFNRQREGMRQQEERTAESERRAAAEMGGEQPQPQPTAPPMNNEARPPMNNEPAAPVNDEPTSPMNEPVPPAFGVGSPSGQEENRSTKPEVVYGEFDVDPKHDPVTGDGLPDLTTKGGAPIGGATNPPPVASAAGRSFGFGAPPQAANEPPPPTDEDAPPPFGPKS